MTEIRTSGHTQMAAIKPSHIRRSPIGRAFLRLRSAPISAQAGFAVISAYLVVAIFARQIAPYGEAELVGPPYSTWDGEHLLGTDQIGRDFFSRLIYGAHNTIGLAVLTTIIAFVLGTTSGLVAAYRGRTIDELFCRVADVLMAIPKLIFALMLLAVLGASTWNLVIILGVLDSTKVFRLVRSVSLNVVAMEYIEYARLRRERLWWIIGREVLPNIMVPLITEFGLRFTFVFLSIASLSFLGLGIQPPAADWGSMVRESSALITYGDITPLVPASAIAILTIAISLVVDWLLNEISGLARTLD
jgi:peptide/nickel transport system permease protein